MKVLNQPVDECCETPLAKKDFLSQTAGFGVWAWRYCVVTNTSRFFSDATPEASISASRADFLRGERSCAAFVTDFLSHHQIGLMQKTATCRLIAVDTSRALCAGENSTRTHSASLLR